MRLTSLLQCSNLPSFLPFPHLRSFIFLYPSYFPPEISSLHSLCLPNPPPPPPPSLFTPLCQYLHPHPSIFRCSSRPPANPLISSHLCLSCTISSTHSPVQYHSVRARRCTAFCTHTTHHTAHFSPCPNSPRPAEVQAGRATVTHIYTFPLARKKKAVIKDLKLYLAFCSWLV